LQAAATIIQRQFDANPDFWRDVYDDPGLAGQVYRRRLQVALSWIRSLGLPRGARALDAGCGAGTLTRELVRRGLKVTALDASDAMLALTREALAREARSRPEGCGREAGARETGGRDARPHQAAPPVELVAADVTQRLPFADGRFALVAGLGLLPWIADPADVVAELARVLVPGGWMLLSADNLARLNFIVEPRESPLLAPLKRLRDRLQEMLGSPPAAPEVWRHRPAQVDALLRAAGLSPQRRETVGFGPFTCLGRRILPDPAAAALHRHLEHHRRASPTLQRTGWHYLVLAQRR